MARNWFYNEYSNQQLLRILWDYCDELKIAAPELDCTRRCSIASTFERLGIDFAGW